MRLLTVSCTAILLSLLFACATNLVVEYPAMPETPQIRDDASLVYFFRPNYHDHNSYHHHKRKNYEYVKNGDEFLGAVTEGSFFFIQLEPGAYSFSCFDIDLEAGQTYYLENYNQYRRSLRQPLILCPPRFVERSPEYAQAIIAKSTYTIARME